MTHCLFAGSSSVRVLDPLHVFQLPHLQASHQDTVQTQIIERKRDDHRQWSEGSNRSGDYGFWVSPSGIHFLAKNETAIGGLNELGTDFSSYNKNCRESGDPLQCSKRFWEELGVSRFDQGHHQQRRHRNTSCRR